MESMKEQMVKLFEKYTYSNKVSVGCDCVSFGSTSRNTQVVELFLGCTFSSEDVLVTREVGICHERFVIY